MYKDQAYLVTTTFEAIKQTIYQGKTIIYSQKALSINKD